MSNPSLRLNFLAAFLLLGFGFCVMAWPSNGQQPICRYKVIPDENGQFITVEADIKLQYTTPYLKDFGQLESIKWYIQGKEVSVKSERIRDILMFKEVPTSGEARVIYKLKCVTKPKPGYRKRLMGSSNFVLAREGLYLGMNGLENRMVDVRWELPSGWQLGSGAQGLQRFIDTQKRLWVAGKMKTVNEEKVGKNVFRIAVLEGTSSMDLNEYIDALKAIFRQAWQSYGPLEADEYGIVIFPRGSIGGGTSLYYTLASEESRTTAVHEMLHWWTNFRIPAWFREGVHTYMAAKILVKFGLISQDQFDLFLKSCLHEHLKVVEREGKLFTLAESSKNYDSRRGGGDMYGLMPVFAYKLDREIQAKSQGASLDKVFAAVCRKRHQKLNLLSLIKDETGYDPGPLFKKYFYARVENPNELLK